VRILLQPARKIAAVLGLGLMLSLAGCQPGDVAFNGNVAQFADTLKMLVEDFARQALAAFLF
jgi:hypothetical protein